jgi:hypothetical protein
MSERLLAKKPYLIASLIPALPHSGSVFALLSVVVSLIAIPGHWEGDLLAGSKNTHIATLVERHSRFVILVKVPSKDTATVVAALSR